MPGDTEFAKWLITLGVGGVLAGFMFAFYRKDVKQFTELWKLQADRLDGLVNTVLTVVRENTASNIKLITLIENQERNVLRKTDIQLMIDKKIGERRSEG